MLYELTLEGFDGGTEATDDRVIWVASGMSPETIQSWLQEHALHEIVCEVVELGLENKAADFVFPEQEAVFLAHIRSLGLAPENETWLNHYLCPCGEHWEDRWDSQCNDHCPSCHAEIEPYISDDGSLTDDERQIAFASALANADLFECDRCQSIQTNDDSISHESLLICPSCKKDIDLDESHQEIRLNGLTLMVGGIHLGVVYNNLAGLNITDPDEYQMYLAYMRQAYLVEALVPGHTLEFLINGKVIATCKIGDPQATRVTQDLCKAAL